MYSLGSFTTSRQLTQVHKNLLLPERGAEDRDTTSANLVLRHRGSGKLRLGLLQSSYHVVDISDDGLVTTVTPCRICASGENGATSCSGPRSSILSTRAKTSQRRRSWGWFPVGKSFAGRYEGAPRNATRRRVTRRRPSCLMPISRPHAPRRRAIVTGGTTRSSSARRDCAAWGAGRATLRHHVREISDCICGVRAR